MHLTLFQMSVDCGGDVAGLSGGGGFKAYLNLPKRESSGRRRIPARSAAARRDNVVAGEILAR